MCFQTFFTHTRDLINEQTGWNHASHFLQICFPSFPLLPFASLPSLLSSLSSYRKSQYIRKWMETSPHLCETSSPLSLMISHELHGWHHSGGHGRPGFVNLPTGEGAVGLFVHSGLFCFPQAPRLAWKVPFWSLKSRQDMGCGVGNPLFVLLKAKTPVEPLEMGLQTLTSSCHPGELRSPPPGMPVVSL